jgi:hypothetical protein
MGSRRFFQARAGKPDANAQTIIDGLRALGHFVVPVRSSDPGVPDLCVYPRAQWAKLVRNAEALSALPVPVWLELKVAKGKLLESQREWTVDALNAGLRVGTVRTLDEALAAVSS